MKKLFLLFLLLFTTDSHSSGIASNTNSAPCTNTTLETYSGNSNLSADWQPNEIQLRWYNGNTLMNVQSSANTCVYDGALAVPQTAPTRTGYTFDGWTVRPEIDFAATIPTEDNGIEVWAKGISKNADYCWYNNRVTSDDEYAQPVNCNSDSTYNELQPYEWKMRFVHGDLYGMVGCSTTSGSPSTIKNLIIDSGNYCWCKVTGYRANNASVISGPASALFWVYQHDDGGNVTICLQYCVRHCVNAVWKSAYTRALLFTPAN